MRNSDGLQPQEAFDELLKYLFFKTMNEEFGPKVIVSFKLAPDGLYTDNPEMAKKIRRLFTEYLSKVNSWANAIWQDKSFHISDNVLLSIHRLFNEVSFAEVGFDIRSAALKEFLPPEIRRGLGIFLTPDDVVKAMVDAVRPSPGCKVYDIAVGSGTFLIEILRQWNSREIRQVWGSEKNPRMLVLADLNLMHIDSVMFHHRLMDSLFESPDSPWSDWPAPNFFDYIFTNPPFGVKISARDYDLSTYKTCRNAEGDTLKKQSSEVMFVEQALRFIKPGGTLAIVLPRSVITNLSLKHVRTVINELGYVYALMILPPETFQTSGAQTITVVLFIRKFEEDEDRDKVIRICVANVDNVGFDSTGRVREGNQLLRLGSEIRRTLAKQKDTGICRLSAEIPKNRTLIDLQSLISGRFSSRDTTKLRDFVDIICNGHTPARAAYSKNGLFLVKVGNLTGNGISWQAGDRNFITGKEAIRRSSITTQMLQKGDIVLTSSAHSPIYIAKKVDMVWNIPDWIGGKASFVGEVMLIRPKHGVNPLALLAFLRLPQTTAEIQRMIRGQTAHLHPNDLMDLSIPDIVSQPDDQFRLLLINLREEAELNERLNELLHRQNVMLDSF